MRVLQHAKRGLSVLLGASLVLSSWSCMGRDGDKEIKPARYAAQDRSFSLEFSDPPWRVVKQSERALRLQVDSEVFGMNLGKAVPPMLILIASAVTLDEHLKDLIDPAQLSELLQKAGVDKDKIPTNFKTFDTKALATLTHGNLTSLLEAGSSLTAGTTSELNLTVVATGSAVGPSTEVPRNSTAPQTKTKPKNKAGSKPKVKVPKVPEYLDGVDMKNARDVAVAELNFLVRENNARIVDGMQYFKTDQDLLGVTYQLTMSPGVFVRNLYLPTRDFTLRVGVMSLFELSNQDIHRLFLSVSTNVGKNTETSTGEESSR